MHSTSRTHPRKERIDLDKLFRLADGRWSEIIQNLSFIDIDDAVANPRHHIPCPIHGGRNGDAYRVFDDFDETGGSVCNTCGFFKDGLSTLAFLKGCKWSDALFEVAAYLGLDDGHCPVPVCTPRPPKPTPVITVNAEAMERLQQLWSSSVPYDHPTAGPLRRYLAHRGLGAYRPGETIRFVAAHPYYDASTRQLLGRFPAMLALMQDNDGNALTIHRTYLSPDGRKASVPKPKKLMPAIAARIISHRCGAIHLVPPTGDTLGIAEGIETAVSVYLATGIPTWSCYSAGVLTRFSPPPGIKRLVIWGDNDASGAGETAAKTLAERLTGLPIQVIAKFPRHPIPVGDHKIDWNDVWNRHGRDGFL